MEEKKEIGEVALRVSDEEGGGDPKKKINNEEEAAAKDKSYSSGSKTRKRVASLDAFRGLTIVLMILVDDAGGAYERIDHSPWNGCTLADFVMPFFLFIVGVAIALALKRISQVPVAIRKIIIRTLKLLFWGIILQGGYSHAPDDLSYGVDMKKIRWFGILQVKCGVRGHLGPACNAVGYVDRSVWGLNHLYSQPVWIRSKACTHSSPNVGPLREDAAPWCLAPFEPEGLLSSVSAILSGTIGVHYGHVLIHVKDHSERLKHWLVMGIALLTCGFTLHFSNGNTLFSLCQIVRVEVKNKAIPLNKQLYSFSYVCVTAGAAGLVLSAFYAMIDVWGLRAPFLWLEWIGMNAMLVFVMAAQGIFPAFVNGWYYETPNNSLVHWIQKHVFVRVWHSQRLGTLLYVIFAEILFWAIVAGILHKLGIYWKL
ncbi:hypothetical protein ZIOFF_058528 [Zingiber officinale]|uniref:Heparan-alpha-glucosaminide N-acetyltransferase catalytic domain-containing protein n=1 Tax=Zingiber officinale TaxID=94328 RepID=A0A8J5F847_ZINOF|nr:hypothetical protein ZIOFF_058528 [Zingiber officinale]